MLILRAVTLAVLLIASPDLAIANAGGTKPPGVVEGPASIIDGDTIEIAGQRIRLNGIDAPESRQTCMAEGVTWAATDALSEFIGEAAVRCEDHGSDRYGRMIGRCYVQGEDIEAWMVLNGWALAYRRFSTEYVDEALTAREARRGLWRGDFVPPWECGGVGSVYSLTRYPPAVPSRATSAARVSASTTFPAHSITSAPRSAPRRASGGSVARPRRLLRGGGNRRPR